ncbi:Rz1-like lysis system protein LysC [Yersinia aleksiciae]|uniref:Rz1-like lysis system protein LysC n=1 Tax=Yersinia aleksiciae TaxID=263819 RepID=UPI004041381C
MKVRKKSDSLGLRSLAILVLFSACLTLLLTSCKSNPPAPKVAEVVRLFPPESALVTCEIPEFTGVSWGDSGIYALVLKRELQICKGRLDEVIEFMGQRRE